MNILIVRFYFILIQIIYKNVKHQVLRASLHKLSSTPATNNLENTDGSNTTKMYPLLM